MDEFLFSVWNEYLCAVFSLYLEWNNDWTKGLSKWDMTLGWHDKVEFLTDREACCINQNCATGGTYSNTMSSLQPIPDFEVLKEPRGLLRLVGSRNLDPRFVSGRCSGCLQCSPFPQPATTQQCWRSRQLVPRIKMAPSLSPSLSQSPTHSGWLQLWSQMPAVLLSG